MAILTGPKGPGEPKTKGAHGHPATVKGAEPEKLEKTQEKEQVVAAPRGDAFVDTPSLVERRQTQELPSGQGEGGKGASVRARLAALGIKGGEGLVKTAASDGIRYSTVPGGRILHGSVTVESARALAKLEGVVRITGDLTIQESLLKSADLLVLKSLQEVGGRFTLEGNSSLQIVDALENLERARGLYFGFNPGITRISLPKLKELEAALIFEANGSLTEISLPSFKKGGRYAHVHDNPALTTVLAPALETLGGELSFVDNPRLITVRLASREKPAAVGGLELSKNGAASFPLLFAQVA